MNHQRSVLNLRQRRKFRVRKRIRGTAECPRLSVFRSHSHIYAQLIDDESGKTLVACSTVEKEICADGVYGGNKTAAQLVGKSLAERAKAAGIERACFDRGPFKYHGRVQTLADAAREGGLQF